MFKACEPGVEVNGETVLAVVAGMGSAGALGLALLAECGIPDPRPGRWYLQQSWLDAFKKIADDIGPYALYQIGSKILENARFPSHIDSVGAALASIDVAYHMNHRNGEIGHYHYSRTGESSARMVCPNPYPCDFDRGIIETVARRFAPEGRWVAVQHDARASCRKRGGESCTYNVSW